MALISRGMGMGDVKLAGLIGIVMGAIGLRYVGVAAGAAVLLGGVGGILALAVGRGRKSAIPFGPYLAAGAVVGGVPDRTDRELVPAAVLHLVGRDALSTGPPNPCRRSKRVDV